MNPPGFDPRSFRKKLAGVLGMGKSGQSVARLLAKKGFKVLGSGPMKLLWTDAARKDHAEPGPGLKEDAEGPLAVVIRANGVEWRPAPTLKATPAEPFDPTKPLR